MKTIAESKFIGNQAMLSAPVPFNLEDGEYLVSIEPKKKKRSLDQNRYFWKLVGEISKHENGDLRDVDELYTQLLQMSGAKYDTVMIKHEALESFKQHQNIRHVKIIKQQVSNHELWDMVYVFCGSSQFDTSEMSQLIDTTLRYAEEAGVPDVNSYWKGVLYD